MDSSPGHAKLDKLTRDMAASLQGDMVLEPDFVGKVFLLFHNLSIALALAYFPNGIKVRPQSETLRMPGLHC